MYLDDVDSCRHALRTATFRAAAEVFRYLTMNLPIAALIVILIALFAGALALSAFVWAIRTKQFSIRQLNEGAYSVFDDDEPVGTPQDMIFLTQSSQHGEDAGQTTSRPK